MFDLSSSSSINTNFFFIDFLCVQTGFYHRLSIEFVLISIENHIDQIYNLETQQYFKILFIFWSLKFWLTLNRIWNKSQKRLIFDWIDINYVGIFFFSFDKALLFSKNGYISITLCRFYYFCCFSKNFHLCIAFK